MSRPKTLPTTCESPSCTEPVRTRIWCKTHAQAWRRKWDHQRCEWDGCGILVATDTGHPKKIDGRTMDTGQGRLSYCRWHEVEHLRPTPEIEALNRTRLGAGLEAVGECWKPSDNFPPLQNGAATYDPEGSNGKVHWAYHRAVWDLLMGGHRQREELDHLTGCTIGARCANPTHLEPVTRQVNMSRRARRNEYRKARKPYGPRTCGPAINWAAAQDQRVIEFAQEFGLPLPTPAVAASK